MIGFVSTQTSVEQLQSATQTQAIHLLLNNSPSPLTETLQLRYDSPICDYIIITDGNITTRNGKTLRLHSCHEFCHQYVQNISKSTKQKLYGVKR